MISLSLGYFFNKIKKSKSAYILLQFKFWESSRVRSEFAKIVKYLANISMPWTFNSNWINLSPDYKTCINAVKENCLTFLRMGDYACRFYTKMSQKARKFNLSGISAQLFVLKFVIWKFSKIPYTFLFPIPCDFLVKNYPIWAKCEWRENFRERQSSLH